MSSDVSIDVRNIYKIFKIYPSNSKRIETYLAKKFSFLFKEKIAACPDEYVALKDVSFVVNKGETVGIIGRNGAGKSTLLQIITGTLMATKGEVSVNGKIGALLELGSGFDPEYTGRENVYLNGAILGLTKDDIDKLFNSIIEFADIEGFIDLPVKTYSSGMLVRLAFAVQAQLSPEVLIVDEALAVGDAKFQARCFERIKKLKESGTSILLVTHSGEQIVTHCDRAIFLDGGQIVFDGEPKKAVNLYMDTLFGKRNEADVDVGVKIDASKPFSDDALTFSEDSFHGHPNYNPHEYRWGDGMAKWMDFQFYSGVNQYPHLSFNGEEILLRVSAVISKEIKSPIVGFSLKTKEGIVLYNSNSELQNCEIINDTGRALLLIATFRFINKLGSGDYFISIGIASREQDGGVIPHDRRYDVIHFLVPRVEGFSGLFDIEMEMENGLELS